MEYVAGYFIAFYSDEGERHWRINTCDPDGPVIIWNPFEKYLADIREGIGEQWYTPESLSQIRLEM